MAFSGGERPKIITSDVDWICNNQVIFCTYAKNNSIIDTMKIRKFSLIALLSFTFVATAQNKKNEVHVKMDLNVVNNDRVMVTVQAPKFKEKQTTYYVPKIVPGTYSEDNYGQFIENFKAYDKNGKALSVAKMDENSWTISDANKLDKITYWVNDTYDIEDTHDIFSPSGTNIEEGKNFLINTHGFVGYFKEFAELPYRLEILKPANLYGATAMVDLDESDNRDEFLTTRYAQLVDMPIMYSKPDYTTFMVDGMEIILAVYSPNGIYNAQQMTAQMEQMMQAQKKFLGKVDNTKKYAILLYMSDVQKKDAGGFGALEHNTSTVVVFPEAMPEDQLIQSMIDVVSHEFFHILTPLNVHSKEIHYFDFNTPQMSQHLWMYEGITEYFANLFQINQGLITEEDFYNRLATKIMNAKRFDDRMPFTKMSKQVLSKPYKDNYLNVYEKGALIAMCLDIELRSLSQGKTGILDMMQKLSTEFGSQKPFDDAELFDKIVSLTYPEIRTFLDTYIAGDQPIPYEEFVGKMGVAFAEMEIPQNVFFVGQTPFITVNPTTMELILIPGMELPEFYEKLGIQGGDALLEFNGVKYNAQNAYDLITESMAWKTGDDIQVKFKRDGKESDVKGKVILPTQKVEGLKADENKQKSLREAWLKG